ncbi:replication-relaxation family protein [Streptomyces sp. BBFR109]|uniref:replication-relaxation family protein n=1 Tax=Streptomyces sp. BBFR109 TaxID=3448172 RepID=UPI003F778110
MQLTSRDRSLIRAVARFGQLDSGHVMDIFFSDLASSTQRDRRLKYLRHHDYLRVVGRRSLKPEEQGTGKYVYILGPEGWRVCGRKRAYRQPSRAVNEHTMAIADAFSAAKRLEKDGRFSVKLHATELDQAHKTVGHVTLTPDLYIEVHDEVTGRDYLWWLEVDRGHEGQDAIHEKMDRYIKAFELSGEYEDDAGNVTIEGLVPFPLIVFLSERRDDLSKLQRFVSHYKPETHGLFKVGLLEEFPGALLSV